MHPGARPGILQKKFDAVAQAAASQFHTTGIFYGLVQDANFVIQPEEV